MKTLCVVLIALILIAQSALAQENLIPDADVLVNPNSYRLKVRHVFAQVFENEVTIRAIVLPSFADEYAVGLRRTKDGAEAFVLKPSSRIWGTELLQMYEDGKFKTFDTKGRYLPLERVESYQTLKKTTPSDYRKIKADRLTRPIPEGLAEKLETLWHGHLLSVRHPPEPHAGADGVTYHFSAWIQGRGQLSGHVWSPEPDSKTGRLVAVTGTLADYANGQADLKKLSERLQKATKP